MRVLADTDAGFASTDPPSSRFTIPRKGRDSWMLLVIPRRLKSQTSERAYIYIYIRSGSARTAPWEAAYADGNANFMRFRRRSYASPPSPRPTWLRNKAGNNCENVSLSRERQRCAA